MLDDVAGYAIGIGPSFRDVGSLLVAEAHRRCLFLHPYTVNSAADLRAQLELGVDGLFTNFPDRLDSELGSKPVKGRDAAASAARAREQCLAGPLKSPTPRW
jgi:glycerophosphoryl diester phosphodiesterase